MNTRFRMIAVILTTLLVAASSAWAIEFKNGTTVTVPAGTTLPDDLYAAGQTVDIGGTVDGDLFGAGSTVSLTGKTTHDAMLAGGTVTVLGTAGDDLRAAGGTVTVSGVVTDNASVAGGNITFASTSKIGRNLAVSGGSVVLGGTVVRSLIANGGQVTINGTVGGNALVNANKLAIGPTAVIRGNLVYTGPTKADIASGAKILGATTYHPIQKQVHRKAPAALFGLWLFSLIAAFIVGAVLLAVAPVHMASVADTVRSKPGMSILVGLILVIVVPIALLIIAITVVGIPLSLILLAGYLITLYVARIVAGLAIGRWIFGRTGNPNASLYVALIVGLLILWLLKAIPVIGWLVSFAALLLGLGAFAWQRYNMTKALRQEGRI
jgi:hypothetical protein